LNYGEKVKLNIEQNLDTQISKSLFPLGQSQQQKKQTFMAWMALPKTEGRVQRKLKVMKGSAIMNVCEKHEGESKFKLEPINTSCMVIR
jgi:hypothetical protein